MVKADNKKYIFSLLTVTMAVFLYFQPVYAHPGKTSSDGCHFCKSNCESWGYTYNTRHGHNGEVCDLSKGPTDPLYGGGGSDSSSTVIQPIYSTPTPYKEITYPTSTPKLKPTSTPKPTLTPSPSVAIISSPTNTLTPTLIPSLTSTAASSNPIQSQVEGISTKNEEGFLSGLFKAIFNLLTFNLFSSKDQTMTSPIVIPTPTITSPTPDFEDLQTTASVLGITTNPTINPNELVEVVSIVDGDTIKVKLDGKVETVRLIGIDTPEVVDPRKPVQCFGKEASNKAKELLTGHKVKLESDPTQTNRDKYNRLLRYAWREDGLFFNDWMIRNGYAHEYTYDIPYNYQTQFKEAEKYARENNLGLWNSAACNP